MKLFSLFFRFYLLTLWHQRGQLYYGWAFFALVIICFPIGLNSKLNVLHEVSAGSIWIALLISILLPVHLIFDEDYRDGSLELFIHKPSLLEAMVLSRLLSQCLIQPLPLALLGGGGLWLMGYPGDLGMIVGALALAGISVVSLTTLGAALTLGLRHRGGLLYMLLLPLLIPILIFGGMITGNPVSSPATGQAIMALGGLACFTLPLSAILSTLCLKAAMR